MNYFRKLKSGIAVMCPFVLSIPFSVNHDLTGQTGQVRTQSGHQYLFHLETNDGNPASGTLVSSPSPSDFQHPFFDDLYSPEQATALGACCFGDTGFLSQGSLVISSTIIQV